MIDAIIDFIVVALVLFFIVKAYNHWTEDRRSDAGPTEIELLTEIRDDCAVADPAPDARAWARDQVQCPDARPLRNPALGGRPRRLR